MPAGSTVELKSGGYHIMLMDLKQELKAGSTISITLEFAKAGKITLDVPVNAIGSMP
jgi:copper(I)-binding protein